MSKEQRTCDKTSLHLAETRRLMSAKSKLSLFQRQPSVCREMIGEWKVRQEPILRWMLINCQLSPLEVGGGQLKLEHMIEQKVVIGVFRHAESKCGLVFGLALLLHGHFLSKVMTFHSTSDLKVKLGSKILQNIRP